MFRTISDFARTILMKGCPSTLFELSPAFLNKAAKNANSSDSVAADKISEFFVHAKKQEELSEHAKVLGPSELWKDFLYRNHGPFIENALSGNQVELANLLANFYRHRVTSGMVYPDSFNVPGSRFHRNWYAKLRIVRSLVSIRSKLEGDTDTISDKLVSSLSLDLGNPLPVRVANKLVPFEQLYHVGIVRDLHSLFPLSQLVGKHIVDLGSGVGNVLSIIAKTLKNIQCTYIDLPENLMLAAYTAQKMCPDAQFNFGDASKVSENPDGVILNFIPYYEIEHLPEQSVNIITNTFSLPEMEKDAAEHYLETMSRILKNDGRFFSINRKETLHNKGQVGFTMTGIEELITNTKVFEKDMELSMDESFSQNRDAIYAEENTEITLYKKKF